MSRSFQELFASGPDYSVWTAGTWNSAGKLTALSVEGFKGNVSDAHWHEHLNGARALIVSPTLPDRTCLFGVIDVDPITRQGKGPRVAVELHQLLHSKELPFVVCESKSNGAHAYIFFTEPVIARDVHRLLAHIVDKLDIKGHFNANIDIRPAASGNGGGTQIQLPYFGTDPIPPFGTSARQMPWAAVEEGREGYMTRDEFVEHCNTYAIVDWHELSKAVTASLGKVRAAHTIINNIDSYEDRAHEGPACFEHYMLEPPDVEHEGHRDNLTYHLGVGLQRMFPDTWKNVLHARVLQWRDPLPQNEVDRVIRSIEKGAGGFLCDHPFAQEHCNKAVCQTRRFGVLSNNKVTEVVGIEITKIIVFKPPEGDDQNTYPVHIYLANQEGYVNTTQDALTSFTKFATDVFHRYKFHIPGMRQSAFNDYINSITGRAGDKYEEVPMPREMTLQGRFERAARARLLAMLHRSGSSEINKETFLRGGVVWDAEKKCLIMDAGVFADALRTQLKEQKLTNTRIIDMFKESTLLAPNTSTWKALYAKNGVFSQLMHFVPRWEGDGREYPEEERDLIWFTPPDETF